MTRAASINGHCRIGHRRSLAKAEDGATLTEFGLLSPVLFLLLFGTFDIGHTIYMQAVLQGSIQKAARDSSLQSAEGSVATIRTAIDNSVKAQLEPLNRTATISFERRFYRSFTLANQAKAEEFTDSASGPFKNGKCDNNESYVDANNNGVYDRDGGDSSDRAGARDNVVYVVTVEYDRLFPLYKFIGGSDTAVLTARTVLANQPYGDQGKYDTPTVRACT